MKKLHFSLLIILASALALYAQPLRPVALMGATMITGSANASEQTSGPVVYDVTGDGLPEVIVTGRTHIWVLNYANQDPGNSLFSGGFSAPTGYEFCGPVSVCHPSSDGYPWIVVGASKLVHYLGHAANDDCPHRSQNDPNSHDRGDCYHWHSIMEAWEITGTTATVHPYPSSGDLADQRLTTPTAADANGDNKDELCFVGSQSYGIWAVSALEPYVDMHSCVGVRFFEFAGGAWTEIPVTIPYQNDPFPQQTDYGLSGGFSDYLALAAQTVPAVGDVNGDGLPDFVTGSLGSVQAFSFINNDLAEDWRYNFNAFFAKTVYEVGHIGQGVDAVTVPWDYANWDSWRVPGPVLSDVDGGGQLSVFVQPTPDGYQGYIWKLHGDGTYSAEYDYAGEENTNGTELAIADDQQIGAPDVFGMLYADTLNEGDFILRTMRWEGSDLRRFGFGAVEGPLYESGINWYPISNNYTPAILQSQVGSAFTVDFVATKFGAPGDSLNFQRTDASDPWAWYQGADGGPVQSAVTATDFDGDGHLDYVLSARFQSGGNDMDSVWVYPTSLPYNPENIEWSGFRNGPAHKGLYAEPVTGTQGPTHVTWEGRITVNGTYLVNNGYTLTIKPGTVLEFGSNSTLLVSGTLDATGTASDSIYFKAEGSSAWDQIYLMQGCSVTLDRCVIHGGNGIVDKTGKLDLSTCRMYDMHSKADTLSTATSQATHSTASPR